MTNLLDLITPTNLDSEREKFLASKSYDPMFAYSWQGQRLNPEFSIKLKYPLWEALKTQDHSAIVSAAEDLFEVKINDLEADKALKISRIPGKSSTGTAEEYIMLLQEGLDEFSLSDIKIILSEQSGFNARPSHAQKLITVSRHAHFEYFSLEGGVRHELVHTLRYRNGKFNHISRSQRFLPTEEGLASWCQDNANNDNGLAQHAMEYVASSVGLRGSLRDIYNTLLDLGMSSDLAWKRACRHKFGFVNTKIPGDILKPAMYYINEQKVASLSTLEKLRLFVGKISLSELNDHINYQGIWPAEQLTAYFKL